MTAPATAARKALLDLAENDPLSIRAKHVHAALAEAASAERSRIRAALRNLPVERIEANGPIGGAADAEYDQIVEVVGRSAALAILDEGGKHE